MECHRQAFGPGEVDQFYLLSVSQGLVARAAGARCARKLRP